MLDKPRISHGEVGGREVSIIDRLVFSYPFLIIGFGLASVWLGFDILRELHWLAP